LTYKNNYVAGKSDLILGIVCKTLSTKSNILVTDIFIILMDIINWLVAFEVRELYQIQLTEVLIS